MGGVGEVETACDVVDQRDILGIDAQDGVLNHFCWEGSAGLGAYLPSQGANAAAGKKKRRVSCKNIYQTARMPPGTSNSTCATLA